nr:alpha/beta hydrolase family protein [Kribbella pittospori]
MLYLLHGCCDGYASWTRSTDVEALSAGSDILVVMPDGGRVGFYSNWVHGPRWETFHLIELRQLLEQAFRAGTRRAVAGVSMGGLGAIDYATYQPRLFCAAASYSGLLNTLGDGGQNARDLLGLIASEGENPTALWGDPRADAARWAAHNPYDVAEGLRGTALFVAGGNGQPGAFDPASAGPDGVEQFVHRQTADFVRRIIDLRIPATIDLYGLGTHTWPYWQRELHRSWPLLTTALGIRASGAGTATPVDPATRRAGAPGCGTS